METVYPIMECLKILTICSSLSDDKSDLRIKFLIYHVCLFFGRVAGRYFYHTTIYVLIMANYLENDHFSDFVLTTPSVWAFRHSQSELLKMSNVRLRKMKQSASNFGEWNANELSLLDNNYCKNGKREKVL